MLSILSNIDEENIEFSKLRIIDFFFVFPHLVSEITFPRSSSASGLKKMAKSFMPTYEILPEKKRLFSEMGDFQIQAIQILKAKGIVKVDEREAISLGQELFYPKLVELISSSRFTNEKFYYELSTTLSDIPLLGDKGIKNRTGLMEYRYDPT
jgi:hypothetical protein